MKHSELRHQPRHVNPRIQVINYGLCFVRELEKPIEFDN